MSKPSSQKMALEVLMVPSTEEEEGNVVVWRARTEPQGKATYSRQGNDGSGGNERLMKLTLTALGDKQERRGAKVSNTRSFVKCSNCTFTNIAS